jgi:hypothetical protein
VKKRIIRSAILGVVSAALVGGLVPHAGATNIGNQGCTPGYWKTHQDNWEEYAPTDTLGDHEADPSREWVIPDQLASFRDVTFADALAGAGGAGLDGAARILFRATVAAYLNAAHEGLGYPYRRFTSPFNILSQLNVALASLNRAKMLKLATTLDNANNLGCPLS